METAQSANAGFTYRRHEPEKTLLYQVLARQWDGWLAARKADLERTLLPAYVEAEMEAFFKCGVLDHGFVVLSCEACGEKLPVAFSCKKRGFCASCTEKRKSETAVHLIDNVLPHTPYRQWVVTFPHALRYWMAASRKLTAAVHRRVSSLVQLYYTYKAQQRGITEPVAGGVTFVQRFGSALNLNVHFHTVAIDGVFSVAGPTPVFYQLPGPTDEEVAGITEAVAFSVIKDLRSLGFLSDDDTETFDPACLDQVFAESEQLAAAVSASSVMRIAFGERAGRKVRRIGRGFGYEDEIPLAKGRRCFTVNGFTIHANRYIGMKDRAALEKLLAYGARGSFSNQRLSLLDPENQDGDLVYTLKTPWTDGTEAIQLSQHEAIEKLVALIPPPYVHMTRYFGVLSSHSKWRRQIVLKPHVKKGFVATTSGDVERMTWAKLLKRVFAIDITRCLVCETRIPPENREVVTSPYIVRGILLTLGLAGRAPARAPPRRLFDEKDMNQRYVYEDD